MIIWTICTYVNSDENIHYRTPQAPIVGRLLRRFPDLDVDLDLSDELVDFPSSHFDAAIRSGVPANAPFVARTLSTGRMVTCASPVYLEEHGRPRRPAELSRH